MHAAVSERRNATHERWMRRCLELARRGAPRPNPMVGAVVVDARGERLGEGWHRAAGKAHAEVNALRDAGAATSLREATLYVNLEPCTHHGRTPPCTDLILDKGVGRVVVGMRDPHEAASGGVERLRAAGVEVTVGVRGKECRRLNEAFARRVRTGRPLLTLKQAQTLGGRVATRTGDSRWISSEEARRRGHRWRRQSGAVLVGSGTAASDDPRLTVRHVDLGPHEEQPRRLVLDRAGRLAPSLRLFSDAHAARTTAVVGERRDAPPYVEALRRAGGQVLRVKERDGHLDLGALLDRLGTPPDGGRPVQSLFVEAGPGLATALFEQDLVDRYYLFVAPRLLGTGTPTVGDREAEAMTDARGFAEHTWETVGGDALFKGFRRPV
jgi:diaminohydroxyphosphoribosylaminopyrimidine deaminase/5-amino-6-(5-phosphoribosylamino)uracil reductase